MYDLIMNLDCSSQELKWLRKRKIFLTSKMISDSLRGSGRGLAKRNVSSTTEAKVNFDVVHAKTEI